MWGCLVPQDSSGCDEVLSVETIMRKLSYGFRVVSKETERQEIVVDNCNLGVRDCVVVQAIHGQRFIVFSFDSLWGIKSL